MKALSLIAAATLVLATLPAKAQFSYVTNGNFNAGLSGWSVISGTVEISSPPNATAALGGPYEFSQVLPLPPIGLLWLSFDFNFNGRADAVLRVAVLDGFTANDYSWTFSSTGSSGWQSFGVGFRADGPMYLSFSNANSASSLSHYLDNVAIVPMPEPSTYALLAAGAVALLTLRRRGRRS